MEKNEFALQVEAIKTQLYKTAYLYLGNEASSLDVVDESIYKALKALRSLRQPEFFVTWMTRIVINECYKELRRLKRQYPEEYLPAPDGKDYDYDSLHLKEAIKLLPEELRSVIILRYFTGLTLTQTAEILSIPQGTVVTRQRKALNLLKLELSEEE
ncbi:MAG: polymerase, sigma-24 subunit, subfamily [Anaerocolumna sp.]|jgi:RNA polymerase sigma-70 factor (ECF subfamily)|nr:polymerase, sigma-24 subunit, subfamily [Anaerocolumna sp.]